MKCSHCEGEENLILEVTAKDGTKYYMCGECYLRESEREKKDDKK
jgi:protein-arginine kinase activator protein McsA